MRPPENYPHTQELSIQDLETTELMIQVLCAIVVVLMHRLCYPENSLKNHLRDIWKLEFLHSSFNRANDFTDDSVVEKPELSHPHLVMTLTVISSAPVPTFTHFDSKSRWSCFWSFAQSILELTGVNERVRNGF